MYWNCYYLPFPSKIRPLKTRKALFFRKVNKNNSFKCDSSDKRSISTTDDSGRAIKADIRVSRSLCADVNFYPKTSRIMNVWVWVRGVTSSRFDVDETLQCRLNKNRNVNVTTESQPYSLWKSFSGKQKGAVQLNEKLCINNYRNKQVTLILNGNSNRIS